MRQSARLWETLVGPVATLQDPELRRQARLLTSILLILLLTTLALFVVRLPAHGLALDVETLSRIAIALFVAPACLLSRRGHIRPVSLAAAGFGSLVLFALAIIEHNPLVPVLDYLAVVLLFGSLFLSAWLNLIVFAVQLAGLLALAWVAPWVTLANLLDGPLSLHLTIGVVVWAIAWHRDRLEAGRREQLALSERRFREIFESSPLGIGLFDAAGQLQTINAAGRAIFAGVELEVGHDPQRLADLNPPAELKPKLQAGEIVRYETQYVVRRAAEGRPAAAVEALHLEVVLTALGSGGQLHGYLVHLVDIGARKRAEAELQQAQAILETTPSLMYIFDLEAQRNVYTNRPLTSVLGYAVDEAVGVPFSPAVLHPDDAPGVPAALQRLAQARDGEVLNREYRVRHADGGWRWIGTREMVFSRARDGAPNQIMGVAQDITARKQADAALRESEERFRVLVNTLPDGIAVVNLARRLTFVSPNGLALFGLSAPAEALGRSPIEFVAPEDQSRVQANIQKVMQGLPSSRDHYMLLRQDGTRFAGEFNAAVLADAAGQTVGLVAVMRDVTARLRADEILRVTLLKYQTLFEAFPLGIVISDQAGQVLEANSVAEALVSVTGAARARRTFDDLGQQAILSDGTPMAARQFPGARALAEQRVIENVELGLVRPDEQVTWLAVTAAPLPLEGLGAVITFSDITERKQAEAVLHRTRAALESANRELERALVREQRLARVDPLTGAHNRRYFFELADHEFEVARRYQQPLAVMMLDLDHFKRVNDDFGHAVGDQILMRAVQVVRAELRSVDIVGRYGGEEFVIVLPMTSAASACPVAERIRAGIAALRLETASGVAALTLSLGIAEMTVAAQGETLEKVIRRADEALYAAKQAGRNQVVCYSAPTAGRPF